MCRSIGLTGMMNEEGRSGEAAASLREMARHHGWAVIAAAALKSQNFKDGDDLSALLGDERVPYEADRVLVVQRSGEVQDCGCVSTGSDHAERPHRSTAALAHAVLGRAFLSGARERISQARSDGAVMSEALLHFSLPFCVKPGLLSPVHFLLLPCWLALPRSCA